MLENSIRKNGKKKRNAQERRNYLVHVRQLLFTGKKNEVQKDHNFSRILEL
jgi:hypothetical protein